ncbi:MAG: ABC transporter ATP-binding protein [Pseudomonadota bacterium]
MTEPLLNISEVGKAYPVYRSEFSRFASWFGLPIKPISEHWAVRDVSFAMQKGEAIGIVGANGAGKSTLLKVITGTVRPTKGTVSAHGRIGSILELGIGFNPEFTGRENVVLSGGLLGMRSNEIEAAMPEIEAFAEIGEFIDHPVRTYSSGMSARLAFSLVTAVRPDLLIVDEVLSVGDSYFQHKSFDRIRNFKEQGTSILLVTHALGDVREICDRVLLLDKGKVLKDGRPDEVIDYYNALIAAKENESLSIDQKRRRDGWMESRSGTQEVSIASIRLLDSHSRKEIGLLTVGQSAILELEAVANASVDRLVLGVQIKDRTGHVVWGTNTWHTQQVIKDVEAGSRIRFSLSFDCDLGPGSYSFSPALVSSDTHLVDNFEWIDNAIVFDVTNADKPYFIGSSYVEAQFNVEKA